MWLGLAVLAVMVGLTRWHNGRVDSAVVSERDRLGAVYAQELADAQAKADALTKSNAEATAQLRAFTVQTNQMLRAPKDMVERIK